MRIPRALILGILTSLTCHADEVVAWKTPLFNFVTSGLRADGVVRCESAPESSPFFKQGDELWDLTKVAADRTSAHKMALEWLVWNATSNRLVAKGNWVDICNLQEILNIDGQPKRCRVTVSVFEVPADGAPLSETSVPISELTTVSRSGDKSKAFWSGAGKSIDLDSDYFTGENEEFVDIHLDGTVSVPDQLPMRVNTSFSMRDGKSLWIARDFDGKKGLDLKVASSVELMDGTSCRERVMIQRNGEKWPISPKHIQRDERSTRVADKGWLTCVYLSVRNLRELLLLENIDRPGADPFKDPPQELPEILPHSLAVKPPEFLQDRVRHEVLNANEWIKKCIPNLEMEGTFSGYDPIEERMYFFSPNQVSANAVCEAFSTLSCEKNLLIISTLDGQAQTRLIGKSGQKTSLTRPLNTETNIRGLEIEPTIGESEDLIEFRFSFENKEDQQHVTRINSSTLLQVGKFSELFSVADGGTGKTSVSAKVEILERNR
jgi:hypothetical protein